MAVSSGAYTYRYLVGPLLSTNYPLGGAALPKGLAASKKSIISSS
jgi:hypothetical protein